MLQKLPVDGFEQVEDNSQFNEDIIKSYNEKSDEGYFIEVNVQYPKKLCELHNNSPISFKKMKIGKVEKLVANLNNKTESYSNKILELNHGLNLIKKLG